MDNSPDNIAPQELSALSYDDTVAYEEQLPTEAELTAAQAQAASLARRIGTSKVYLLSESSAATRAGKRKHTEGEEEDEDKMNEDDEMDESSGDLSYRPNALLFTGTPIAHLPTARLFAYATHFDAHPLGLEWVDDNTCVFVFDSTKAARDAFSHLLKSPTEEPDMDEFITAKPFPIALWPPEERINQTLGKGQGLKGVIRMRWAKADDVKKKGAKRESQFYKKHGASAGKELFDGRDMPPPKRRRRDEHEDDERRKAELDHELDEFLAESGTDEENGNNGEEHTNGKRKRRPRLTDRLDDPSRPSIDKDADIDVDETPIRPPSPPSKMRSDYIATDGRTLLERTSFLRLHSSTDGTPPDLASRLTAPLPRRARGRRNGTGRNGRSGVSPDVDVVGADNLGGLLELPVSEKLEWGRREREPHPSRSGRERERDRDRERERDGGRDREGGRKSRRGERPARTAERPRKTQQELDDELDAFLNAHD